MFTGLVEEVGHVEKMVKNRDGATLTITAEKVLMDTTLGDSIAIDGVCLSVTELTDTSFTVQAVHETLQKSTLSNLTTGAHVNLERAMAAGGRFGGHIVQGHVDGTGKISKIQHFQQSAEITLKPPKSLMTYIVSKGSITLSGISLTVAEKTESTIKISVIPITFQDTNLKERKEGDAINIEVDIFAKYVENFFKNSNTQGIEDKMKSWGYQK